mmetsp:Transcript_7424/g.17008  ORF Transcript_7424/g.17008 Transcript_7424/m.17008 type:complete len:221 (+) Transcript_7424:2149-2811(+)
MPQLKSGSVCKGKRRRSEEHWRWPWLSLSRSTRHCRPPRPAARAPRTTMPLPTLPRWPRMRASRKTAAPLPTNGMTCRRSTSAATRATELLLPSQISAASVIWTRTKSRIPPATKPACVLALLQPTSATMAPSARSPMASTSCRPSLTSRLPPWTCPSTRLNCASLTRIPGVVGTVRSALSRMVVASSALHTQVGGLVVMQVVQMVRTLVAQWTVHSQTV